MRLLPLLLSAACSIPLLAQTFPGFSPLADVINPDPLGEAATLTQMATDASGDVYLVGRTTAYVPGPIRIGAAFGAGDLLIVKMDARLEQVRFTAEIGAGTGNGAQASAIRVDPSGNLYILGTANADDFPYTKHLGTGTQSAFLLKLSPSGDRLIYATQLGNMDASMLDIDASGAAYIGARSDSDAFVMKVSPAGDAIAYRTIVAPSTEPILGLVVSGIPRSACTRGSECRWCDF